MSDRYWNNSQSWYGNLRPVLPAQAMEALKAYVATRQDIVPTLYTLVDCPAEIRKQQR